MMKKKKNVTLKICSIIYLLVCIFVNACVLREEKASIYTLTHTHTKKTVNEFWVNFFI